MIRESNQNQRTLVEFDWPFLEPLDEDNRWVKLADIIRWQALSEPHLKNFTNTVQGRSAKPYSIGDRHRHHQAQTVFIGS